MLTGDGATNGQGPQIVFSESGSGSNFAGAYIGHVRLLNVHVFAWLAHRDDVSSQPVHEIKFIACALLPTCAFCRVYFERMRMSFAMRGPCASANVTFFIVWDFLYYLEYLEKNLLKIYPD